MKVRVGDVIISEVKIEDGGYMGYRVTSGTIGCRVGQATTQRGAMTLIAQSLISRSIDDSLSSRQRERLREVYRILDVAGLSNVAKMISEALE